MKMIQNKSQLDKEIVRLTIEIKLKEQKLQTSFDRVSEQFEPGALLSSGVKSFFHQQTKNKTIVTTTLTILAGFLVERVILRKSNMLVKYGIAQLAMGLVTKLADENWHPEIFTKIKDALANAISGNQEIEVENTEQE